MNLKSLSTAIIGTFCATVACATVRLPALIGDNMVLQRDTKVIVWGWADPGEKVRITFQGSTSSATADAQGKWAVPLGPYPAGGPYEMRIRGENEITLRNISMGDVWLASGQSNMSFPMQSDGHYGGPLNAEEEIARSAFPDLRLFTVKKASTPEPVDDVTSQGWRPANLDTVPRFSAVAYFFGRDLQQRYHVPIGMIESDWGGTAAEVWVSASALAKFPEFKSTIESLKETMDPKVQVLNPPPTTLFNGMINPLTSYRIKGVIWYQGEANADQNRAVQYRTLFPALIKDWRDHWRSDFPFLFVQLAGYGLNKDEPAEYRWADLREAQAMALSLPKTGMATAIDLGEERDIHPRNKQDVASRLALVASKVAYGENIASSGPTYASMQIEGNRIRIKYEDIGSGLKIHDKYGYIRGFQIAGADGKFVWANAKLDGSDVLVFSERVPEPRAVRYGWANMPDGNVFNKEGLPALPFRTDFPGLDSSSVRAPVVGSR